MDREIKFRGLAINTQNAWIEGNLIIDGKRAFIFENFLNSIGDVVGIDGFFEVKPETVGQFTGLRDKEGAEIWEGDIVYIGKRGHVIEWRDGGMGYFVDHIYGWVSFSSHKFIDKYRQRSCVKGNIHQQEA